MTLMFQSKVLIFISNSKSDFVEWEKAVSSYVINSKKVVNAYNIIDKLGRVSFGFVLLATEKMKMAAEIEKENVL